MKQLKRLRGRLLSVLLTDQKLIKIQVLVVERLGCMKCRENWECLKKTL